MLSIVGEVNAFFWATHSEAELDLLVIKGGKRYGFEIKYTETPRVTKSMQMAMESLKLHHLDVIYPGEDIFALGKKITAKPLSLVMKENMNSKV